MRHIWNDMARSKRFRFFHAFFNNFFVACCQEKPSLWRSVCLRRLGMASGTSLRSKEGDSTILWDRIISPQKRAISTDNLTTNQMKSNLHRGNIPRHSLLMWNFYPWKHAHMKWFYFWGATDLEVSEFWTMPWQERKTFVGYNLLHLSFFHSIWTKTNIQFTTVLILPVCEAK